MILFLSRYLEREADTTDASHDIDHLIRVLSITLYIVQTEGGDMSVIVPAALLHDIVNVPKNSPNRTKASEFSAHKAAKILELIPYYPLDKIPFVMLAIRQHSYSRGEEASTLESQIVKDADRLDSSGALALARTFASMANMRGEFYHPTYPLFKERKPDPGNYALDFILTRLLMLKDGMHTTIGRQWGRERERILTLFRKAIVKEAFLSKAKSQGQYPLLNMHLSESLQHLLAIQKGSNLLSLTEHLLHSIDVQLPLDDPSHNIEHLIRVLSNAIFISAYEDANMNIVIPAVLFHNSVFSPDQLTAILSDVPCYPPELIPLVISTIQSHRSGEPLTELHAKALRDANYLDSLGAMAIARTFASMSKMGGQFYHREDPLCQHRQSEPKKYALDYIRTCLMTLKDKMNTIIGKHWATQRAPMLELFQDLLVKEAFLGNPDRKESTIK